MFEALEMRARRLAERRAEETARRLAARLAEALPPGVKVATERGWITLSGPALNGRLATNPALRLAFWELIDER